MKTLLSVLTTALLVCVTTVQADAGADGSKNFEKHIQAYQQSCASGGCRIPFSERSAYAVNESDKSQLDAATRVLLEKVATEQAQIWADTILEGDYQADGKTQLDRVFAIFENGQFLGYKITYSERAWFIGECDYDYDRPESLNQCHEGRIEESSFVSPDFATYFRDESDLADFVK
jgi:hypothetical protein